ncbi:uncharacterized protein LOC123550921 isoform X2 [Mercenaria mercenaria]|uniref:uncharacterized protein LOC123550921 isoform X2 n=1 Tax=Mercenaria mercenaria TaxID=6596 RepID=UPI00234EB187|nr:uncharacterized protein LOC123550921 isoform X2 [Mercenaria mercenaria]
MEEKESTEDNLNEKKKKVGNYLLGRIIGEGAFAKIRQGLHIIAREKVAVKIVPKKAALLREYVKKGVRREAMLLQKLEHPNIIRLYEIMETENSYYLVLELAESGEFIKYLSEKKKLSERECQKFIRQMASAVDHMYTSNITHRDLKLENLLLDKDNNIKIIDFGLSNVFYGDSSLNTQCGSPVYAAPEIFCNRKYGPAVDIWSMGICMYAMLTGKLPFLPDPPNNLTLLHSMILRGAHIPETISDGCANLLARMLCVDFHYRIPIEDVLSHSWIMENHQTPLITRQPPIGKLYPHVPKAAVVSYMTTVYNFIEDDVFYSVMERKMNAVAATYHLLLKRFDAGIHLMGLSMGAPAPFKLQHPKLPPENIKVIDEKIGFPALSKDITLMSEGNTGSSKTKFKSYIQLLKDSKLKSAQSASVRSGYSLSSKQKDFTLRRYKTRTDIARHTKTKEETGFLPDFILTYTQNENSVFDSQNRKSEKFEWEQTFIISKKETTRFEPSANVKSRQSANAHSKYSETVRHTDADGRNTAVDVPLQAPPTTPISPAIPREHVNAKGNNLEETKNSADNEDGKRPITVEDPYHGETWSTFHRQKAQLARAVNGLERNTKQSAYQFHKPITKPKTLTQREAKSYFDEINNAQVIGQEDSLKGRKPLPVKSKSFILYGRERLEQPVHIVNLPSLPIPQARSADHPPMKSNSERLTRMGFYSSRI